MTLILQKHQQRWGKLRGQNEQRRSYSSKQGHSKCLQGRGFQKNSGGEVQPASRKKCWVEKNVLDSWTPPRSGLRGGVRPGAGLDLG